MNLLAAFGDRESLLNRLYRVAKFRTPTESEKKDKEKRIKKCMKEKN